MLLNPNYVYLDASGQAAVRGRPELFVPSLREFLRGIGLVMVGGVGTNVAKKLTDHMTGKASYTSPAPLHIALCTTVPTDTNTSADIVEATYAGYPTSGSARLQIPAVDWNSASGGPGVAATNANQKLAAAHTGGASTSTITGWALTPTANVAAAGDITHFGTCASTVISSTQTPPTINAGALSIGFD